MCINRKTNHTIEISVKNYHKGRDFNVIKERKIWWRHIGGMVTSENSFIASIWNLDFWNQHHKLHLKNLLLIQIKHF